ncbi:MAG: hypothetical protein HY738_01075 [Bacteroidia bacterium]|nr:hypothetical protein [Bacteroidia bacterium]
MGSDLSGNGSYNYPFRTIQRAINCASSGDFIYVMPGTYNENITIRKDNIKVYSYNNDPITTIIRPQNNSQPVVLFTYVESSSCQITYPTNNTELKSFTIKDSHASGIEIQGAEPTLINLIIKQNSANNGGGISCDNYKFILCGITTEQVSIVNCKISDNYAQNMGGGLYCQNSTINITNDTKYPINYNQASLGGAICSLLSNISIQNSDITNNSVSWMGGGIYCEGYTDMNSLYIEKTTIQNNTIDNSGTSPLYGAGIYCLNILLELKQTLIFNNYISSGMFNYSNTTYGGGIYCAGTEAHIENSAIVDNTTRLYFEPTQIWYTQSYGGGIYAINSSLNFINSTLAGNSSSLPANQGNSYLGNGIYLSSSGSIQIKNSIIWNNAADNKGILSSGWIYIDHSDIQEGSAGILCLSVSWGNGNIDSDPLFVSNTDHHLQPTSPCISMGLSTYYIFKDIEGNPRMADGSNPDMGAYESTASRFAELYIPRSGEDMDGATMLKNPIQATTASCTIALKYGTEILTITELHIKIQLTLPCNQSFSGSKFLITAMFLPGQDNSP